MKQKYVIEFEIDESEENLIGFLEIDVVKMMNNLHELLRKSKTTKIFLLHLLKKKQTTEMLWLCHYGIKRFLREVHDKVKAVFGEKKI